MENELTRRLFRTYAEAGTSYTEIAEILGLDVSTCFDWRKQMGIPNRVRGAGAPCRKLREEKKKRRNV